MEKRIKPTVIRRRMKQQPAEESVEKAAEPVQTETIEEERPAKDKLVVAEKAMASKPAAKKTVKKKPEAARIIEMAPKPAPKIEKVPTGRKPEVVRKPVPGDEAPIKPAETKADGRPLRASERSMETPSKIAEAHLKKPATWKKRRLESLPT